MRAILLFPVMAFVSCVNYHDMYNNRYTSVGGDADVTFPGGGHMTHSHTGSFQHFMQGAVAITGSVAGAIVQKSSDSLAGIKDTNAAGVTKNAQDNATQQAADKLKAASQDLGTTTHAGNAVSLTQLTGKGPPRPVK